MTEANRIATHVLTIATVRPALMIVGFLAAIGLARCDGQRSAKADVRLAAKIDTVRISDSVAVVRTDTVIVRQRAVTRWDTVVRNVSDSQIVIRSDTVTVPVEIVRRDEDKDRLILSLYQRDTTRLWQIESRDKHHTAAMAQANAPRWGYGATLGYGCNPNGCGPTLNVGLSYQARFPNWKAILSKAVK